MRAARLHITAAICAAALSVGVVALPSLAFGDTPSTDEGDGTTTGDDGDDSGTTEGGDAGDEGSTGTTEAGSDDGESTEFDNGFQGQGPAELAGEEGGGCGLVSEGFVGVGFLGLLGLGAARRREAGARS